jgi:hypothetical protein
VQLLAEVNPPQQTSILSLAFSASGLYFGIGCANSNVYVMDTSAVNSSKFDESINVHVSTLNSRGMSLSSVTAVAFSGLDSQDRIIVGDRYGNVSPSIMMLLLT